MTTFETIPKPIIALTVEPPDKIPTIFMSGDEGTFSSLREVMLMPLQSENVMLVSSPLVDGR